MIRNLPYLTLLFAAFFFFSGCEDDDAFAPDSTSAYSSDVVEDWIDLSLKVAKETPGFSPPVTARVIGYSGLALYEAVQPGEASYKSLQGQLAEFTAGTIPTIEAGAEYHWGAVANATLAAFLSDCFVTTSQDNKALITGLEDQYLTQFSAEASAPVINRSVAYGRSVAAAIITYADSDGQRECYNNNFPASYVVPTGDALWVSINPANALPLQPYWGSVRTFVSANASVLPPAPPAFSTDPTSAFYQEAMEVYTAVNNLTDAQRIIAEFWSDDPGTTATPPGHSLSIMLQAIQAEDYDLMKTAETYAKVGMGAHDAFVSCWNAKYIHNLLRPITYVHRYIDASWTTPLITPPFPEYTSGHSVQSGAVAQVLTDEFGENYAFVDNTHALRTDIDGTPRNYASFYAFADEAAISRLYGGIHFRSAIDLGVLQGYEIGRNISALEFQ